VEFIKETQNSGFYFSNCCHVLGNFVGSFSPLIAGYVNADLYQPMKIIFQWILLPFACAFTSAVFARTGVLYLICWIVPMFAVAVLPWAIMGYRLMAHLL